MSQALSILDGDIDRAEDLAAQLGEDAPDIAALAMSIVSFGHAVTDASENEVGGQFGYLDRDQFAAFLALLKHAADSVAVALYDCAIDDWPVDQGLIAEADEGLRGTTQALHEIITSLAGEPGRKKRWWR
jgi:hypothetical protein